MKVSHLLILALSLTQFIACSQPSPGTGSSQFQFTGDLPPVISSPDNYNELDAQEERIILNKGTERAFTGAYYDNKKEGVYLCRQCNNPLFRSTDKFDSGTGWPSFDDVIDSNVKEVPDADGSRTEIVCANCGGHLGHVFRGEGFTEKQTRHCANSASLAFLPGDFAKKEAAKQKNTDVQPIEEYVAGKGYEQYAQATFAGGCFWCTEASFEQIAGVVDVISGYCGGTEEYPTYEEVGYEKTHHAESIMIYYDPEKINYETLLHIFFTAHDPTQLNRQGPDVGPQYRSAIFYHNEEQKAEAEAVIAELGQSGKYGSKIVTELSPYKQFWTAEAYHQDYYVHHPENPYVQRISKPKVEKVKKAFSDILKEKNKQ